MNATAILKKLESLADPDVAASAVNFGIASANVLGLTVPQVRALAKDIGKDHKLAIDLWNSDVFEARLLCSLIADPARLTEAQMERWAKDFDSWAICDACCGNLFDKTPLGWVKAVEWSTRRDEYVKRAAFALMAVLAVHDKVTADSHFVPFLPIIKREAGDDRNFVKKAVNWALRQIGKRSLFLNVKALKTAQEIRAEGTPSGRWIAADAIRELSNDGLQRKLSLVNRPALRSM